MSSLRSIWELYSQQIGASVDVINKYWNVMETKYSESQRYYHTLDHIKDMFTHFEDVKPLLKCPELVAMAIVFHDVIYDPTEKDNEEKSADLYREFSKEFNGASTETVYDWIIQTKSHVTDVTMVMGSFGDNDLHYFLDMDMAILASSPERYIEYAKEIRKEYSHFPDKQFTEGRAKVLKTFLERINIYNTKVFRSKYEDLARKNITEEIHRLEQGIL